jgi:hypothetical protein
MVAAYVSLAPRCSHAWPENYPLLLRLDRALRTIGNGFFASAGRCLGHQLGVVGRGPESGGVSVGSVADYQSNTLFSSGYWSSDDKQHSKDHGTNLSMVRLAAAAELWLGKPVIAINTATYWHALRANGILDQFSGFGRLLEAL